MTTLELTTSNRPYIFKSLGSSSSNNDFPVGHTYTLTSGKFPLTDYNDLFKNSRRYHTLNGNTQVKITGFVGSCIDGNINRFGSCQITVEKESSGGKKRGSKNKSKRRKSKRRKSKRRKSKRRR